MTYYKQLWNDFKSNSPELELYHPFLFQVRYFINWKSLGLIPYVYFFYYLPLLISVWLMQNVIAIIIVYPFGKILQSWFPSLSSLSESELLEVVSSKLVEFTLLSVSIPWNFIKSLNTMSLVEFLLMSIYSIMFVLSPVIVFCIIFNVSRKIRDN